MTHRHRWTEVTLEETIVSTIPKRQRSEQTTQAPHFHPAIRLRYNPRMITINTIEDLARTLRDQPTWAEAPRALLLT